jgi:hypothetical protein
MQPLSDALAATEAAHDQHSAINPSDLRSNSLKGVPTAQICLLKSMGVFGCDLSEKPLKNLAKASDFQAEYGDQLGDYFIRIACALTKETAASFIPTLTYPGALSLKPRATNNNNHPKMNASRGPPITVAAADINNDDWSILS